MASDEERERHLKRRKRNFIAKSLRDSSERRGAFALKIINPKKTIYKREKVDLKNIEKEEE